jgi:galactose mutarotase-like enzyme
LKIETIHEDGNSASYCPERGGLITSVVIQGVELLYLDHDVALADTSAKIRGGIPTLFPNAGGLPDTGVPENLRHLKKHGFARESNKWRHMTRKNEFVEGLKSDRETWDVYPFSFSLQIFGSFRDGSFMIEQLDTSHSDDSMPVSMGLHPYFRVPGGDKRAIEFRFPGGEIIKDRQEEWMNGKAVSIALPEEAMQVLIPGLGLLRLRAAEAYRRLWVWSQPGKNFICLEPVMRDGGGIVTNPVLLNRNEAVMGRFRIGLTPA